MKVIGITGGIGSGKSLVADILQNKYHAKIIDTDRIAREQMEIGGASFHNVVDCFGEDILTADGSIDRKKLAEIVFQDKEKLNQLNQLTHPPVLGVVQKEILQARSDSSVPYLIIETALMIEAGFDFICDEVWYVYAPEEHRRNWLKNERGYPDEKIDAIFKSQSKEEAFRSKFPRVIENVGGLKMVEQQIEKLLDTGQS